MRNLFYELNEKEALEVEGGANWAKIAGGVLIVAGAVMSCGALTPAAIAVTGAGVIGGVGCIIDGI